MTTIVVSPDEMQTAARKVEAAGNRFGREAQGLRELVSDASLYGGDELGRALRDMDQAACPAALSYYKATGECVGETATAIDGMAKLYQAVEQDNAKKVEAIIAELGEI